MFGQTTTASSGGFGSSSSGGLFGNTQNSSSGGLFGNNTNTTFGQAGTNTPNKSPFQSTNTNTGGSNLFGGGSTSTNTGGKSLFGGSTTQPSTGGLFGGTNTASSGGGLFGNTGSTTTTTATSNTGVFGSSNTGGGGLFGSSSNTNTASGTGLFGSTAGSSTGGGLFGNTSTLNTTNAFGSGSVSAFGAGAQQQVKAGAERFSGSIPLLTYAEATDLRFGNIPNGLGSDQNACVKNGIIPEPLRTQFMEQEARMSAQEYKLSEVSSESTDEFSQLLRLTAKMDQSVSHLRSLIDQQREAVQFLVFEAKGCGRVAEKALHEARRLNNTANLHMINKPIPSDFFWKLVQSLEARIEEYQAKSNELHKVLFGDEMAGDENTAHSNNRRLPASTQSALATQNILETLRQQHRGFKVVASQVAATHEKMNALREQYNDWIVLMTGQQPKDFQQEDNAEKERRQRLLRKVEESAQAISVSGAKPTNQQGTTSNMFGNAGQSTSSTSGGLFGSTSTSNTGGLLGNTSTQSSGTGLFGNASGQNNSTPGTGLFGTSSNTATQGSGLFGSTSSTNSSDQSSSLFGGSSLTAAPRKNKTKRSSSKYR